MNKKFNVIKYMFFLILFLIPLNIKAESCAYEVDVAYADGDKLLSCHNTYDDALTAMNKYNSTDKNVAVIKQNGTIINAKYAIAKIDVENGGEIQYNTDGVKNIYRTSGAAYYHCVGVGDPDFLTYIATTWGSDAAFLNYDVNLNTVNIKISGVNGWVRKSDVIIIPISRYYGSTYNYSSNKPKIRATKDAITLRSGPGTSYSKINTYSSVSGHDYEYYPSQTTEDDTYYWYKVNYNNQATGWLASKKNENWLIDVSTLRNDTYYYSMDNILYHHVHKGALRADVNMTLGTAPYVYLQERVKTYYLSNSISYDIGANVRYFSFDSNYFYDSYPKMIDDYRNGNYNNALNSNYPYYSYFMYLPSRSLTGYTANSFNQMVIDKGFTSFPINPKNYIDPNTGGFKSGYSAGSSSMMFGIGESIIKAQNTYGANAMNIFSNAIRESGTGTSAISFYKNNLFGMGAVDGNAFNGAYSYNSVQDSVMDYAKKLSYGSAYSDLNDYRYNGTHEGNKLSGKGVQYASDPYSGEASTGTAFWNDFYSGKIDEFKNTLGIKNNQNYINIYSEANSSSRVIYQTKNYVNGRALNNMPFIVTDYVEANENGKMQGFYKVFSDVNLDDNRYFNINSYYDFNKCYGYIKKEDLYVQNHQPVINANDVSIEQFAKFQNNVTAMDYENGDISSRIKVNGEVNTDVPGIYTLTYFVTDNEGFNNSKQIKVNVGETSKPIITLKDISIPQYTKYDALTDVTAYDVKDGDLTKEITIIDGKLNTDVQGEYIIKYQVKDSDNNIVSASRKINVIANEVPVITANNITSNLNEPINVLANVKAYDKEDGDITNRITYTGTVINDKIGSYQITYSVTDNAKQTTKKTINVTIEEKKYILKDNIYHLESLSYNKDTKKVDIVGFLIIKGMNNLPITNIKYDMILENQVDGNETTISLSRMTKDMPFSAPSDSGFTNTGAWFKDSIDLSKLDNGDYTVYIRARSGDFEVKTVLKNPFFNEKFVRKFNIDSAGYMFKTNYYNRQLPLELFVRKQGLLSDVNNPTIDNMYNQVYDINLNQDKLNITASSHNVKGNYAENQNVIRELYLEDINTKEIIKKYDVGSITSGPYVISLKQSDGFSKTRAWYKTELDLSNVKVGEYAIVLKTKTGNVDDFGELYDILFKNISQSSKKSDRKYSISRNDNLRYRIELKIEE